MVERFFVKPKKRISSETWPYLGSFCFEGITGSAVFQEFLVETFEEETDVIKYLDQKKVLGYWKQCKEFQDYETFNMNK